MRKILYFFSLIFQQSFFFQFHFFSFCFFLPFDWGKRTRTLMGTCKLIYILAHRPTIYSTCLLYTYIHIYKCQNFLYSINSLLWRWRILISTTRLHGNASKWNKKTARKWKDMIWYDCYLLPQCLIPFEPHLCSSKVSVGFCLWLWWRFYIQVKRINIKIKFIHVYFWSSEEHMYDCKGANRFKFVVRNKKIDVEVKNCLATPHKGVAICQPYIIYV